MMMNTKNSVFSLTLAVVSSFLFFACQEDETISSTSDADTDQLVTDEVIADDLFEDMDEISMEAAVYATNGRLASEGVTSGACVTRTVERNQDFSSKITLTFSGECEGPKGRIRTGTMLVNRNLDFEAGNFPVSTTFQDFHVNGRKVEGTRTLVYSSEDKKLLTVNITLSSGKVTLEDGSVVSREGNFTRIIDRDNGQISMSGIASGINRFGTEYTTEITSDLIFKKECVAEGIFMPVRGTKIISRNDKADVQLDFGDGTCDKTVTLMSENEERTIELKISKK